MGGDTTVTPSASGNSGSNSNHTVQVKVDHTINPDWKVQGVGGYNNNMGSYGGAKVVWSPF